MRAVCISTVISLAIVAMCAAPALAQQPRPAQSPEVLTKVYACAAVAGAEARLACFDAAVAGLQAAETQGEFAAVDAGQVRQIERESFGFSLPSLPSLGLRLPRRAAGRAPAPDVLDAQAMTIARLGRFDGHNSFVMDNGQIWISIDTVENRQARQGGQVTVKKAALGSYLMSVNAGGPAMRVRRAQ